MTRNPHPLTETAAAELWDASRDPRRPLADRHEEMHHDERATAVTALRASFDAGREHEREHTDPHHDPRPWQDCTVGDICAGDLVEARAGDILCTGVAHHQDEDGDWRAAGGWPLTNGDNWTLRRIPAPTAKKDTPMTETTPAEPLARTLLAVPDAHGAPHHDVKEIKPGDYVAQVDQNGFIRGGIAHRQDGEGDWRTGDGDLLTWAAIRADRPEAVTVWPAPTPPAEEIALPTEHPAHITDVETSHGTRCAYMALDRQGLWIGVNQDGEFRLCRHTGLVAFTLPDGTRARRDGDHEDGTPRFIKVQEAQA